jgi:hypothetical protein
VFAPEVLDPTVDFLAAPRCRRVGRPGHRPGAAAVIDRLMHHAEVIVSKGTQMVAVFIVVGRGV